MNKHGCHGQMLLSSTCKLWPSISVYLVSLDFTWLYSGEQWLVAKGLIGSTIKTRVFMGTEPLSHLRSCSWLLHLRHNQIRSFFSSPQKLFHTESNMLASKYKHVLASNALFNKTHQSESTWVFLSPSTK